MALEGTRLFQTPFSSRPRSSTLRAVVVVAMAPVAAGQVHLLPDDRVHDGEWWVPNACCSSRRRIPGKPAAPFPLCCFLLGPTVGTEGRRRKGGGLVRKKLYELTRNVSHRLRPDLNLHNF